MIIDKSKFFLLVSSMETFFYENSLGYRQKITFRIYIFFIHIQYIYYIYIIFQLFSQTTYPLKLFLRNEKRHIFGPQPY